MTGQKGLFVIAGQPGSWKSTIVATTFQQSLHYCSAPNVLHFYKVWHKSAKAPPGLTMPTMIVLDRYEYNGKLNRDPHGNIIEVDQEAAMLADIKGLIDLADRGRTRGEPIRIRTLVLDEGTEFWDRFLTVYQRKLKDGRAAFGALLKWTNDLLDLLRVLPALGINVVIVCHDTEPEGDKMRTPTLPSLRIARVFGAKADATIFRRMEEDDSILSLPPALPPGSSPDLPDPTPPPGSTGGPGPTIVPVKYVWDLQLTRKSMAKIRGVPAEDCAALRKLSLDEILHVSGFEP